jgi:REP element-mobilizing transposase RayT
MSTPPRYFQAFTPYHVYNRGNRKSEIFFQPYDYQRFLQRMITYAAKFDVEIYCYCLMPNHFHLLAYPQNELGLTTFMLRLCTSYAKYFNIRYKLIGRLFQERFRAKIVDSDAYLLQLSRYIHLNPVSDSLEELVRLSSTPGVERERIRQCLREYRWSSYHEYVNQTSRTCVPERILAYFSTSIPSLSYQSFVESGITAYDSLELGSYV